MIELLVSVAIVGLLAAISANVYANALEKSKVTRVIAEIRGIEKAIADHQVHGDLPDSLDDIDWGDQLDPWGHPYRYLKFTSNQNGKIIPGEARKDRFLVPLNSDYDLYSMGPDGESKTPLTAQASRDDILRAADGAFVGPASEF
jgi:general secretion pathway protein G